MFYTIYNDNCQVIPGNTYALLFVVCGLVVVLLLPHTLMLILCVMTFVNMKRRKRRAVVVFTAQSQKQTRRFEAHIFMACNGI